MIEPFFTKAGAEPVALPYFDIDASGETWADLQNNEPGREACGWEAAPDQPSIDQSVETVAWNEGAWIVTPIPSDILAAKIEEYRQERIAALADLRWQRQQSFVWNGATMPSDTNTIALVSAKVKILEQRGTAEDAPFTWKPGPATFVSLTLATLRAYGDAIDLHVQACFDHEEALCADLSSAAATRDAIDAIDIDAGWSV